MMADQDSPVEISLALARHVMSPTALLEFRHRLYWKYRAEGLAHIDAGLAVGYSRIHVMTNLYSEVKKSAHAFGFDAILDAAGADDEAIAKAISDGLKATKRVLIKENSFTEDIDHHARLKAAGLAGKFKGHEKSNINQKVTHTHRFEDVVQDARRERDITPRPGQTPIIEVEGREVEDSEPSAKSSAKPEDSEDA